MGTRGTYGIRKNNKDKLTCSVSDSAPIHLGVNMAKFISSTSVEEMKEIFDNIILVDEFNSRATKEEIEECIQYYNPKVDDGRTDNWYCLLRKSLGTLLPYKNNLRYMIDDRDFIKNGLYCEWGYIINLDSNKLEIYVRGSEKPENNRYKVDTPTNGYYNCKLYKEIDLSDVTEEYMRQLDKEYYEY